MRWVAAHLLVCGWLVDYECLKIFPYIEWILDLGENWAVFGSEKIYTVIGNVEYEVKNAAENAAHRILSKYMLRNAWINTYLYVNFRLTFGRF
jgi:hypothetical protein